MNEQTKKGTDQQTKPVYRELVTINGKNVVLAHNEPERTRTTLRVRRRRDGDGHRGAGGTGSGAKP